MKRHISTFVRAVKLAEDLKQGRTSAALDARYLLMVNRKPVVKQSEHGAVWMKPLYVTEEGIRSVVCSFSVMKSVQPQPNPIFLSVGTATAAIVESSDPDQSVHPYYAVGLKTDDDNGVLAKIDTDAMAVDLRWSMFVTDESMILSKAQSLLQWLNTFKTCPRCTRPLTYGHGNSSAHCNDCGSSFYPTVSPCIITLITDEPNQHLLLVRQKRHYTGIYTCVAGFAEPGESLESTVEREVAEEVGLPVLSACYAEHSQHWPFPQSSLMMGFRAVVPKDHPLEIDCDEIEDAQWFDRDTISRVAKLSTIQQMASRGKVTPDQGFTNIPPPGTAANRLINAWLST